MLSNKHTHSRFHCFTTCMNILILYVFNSHEKIIMGLFKSNLHWTQTMIRSDYKYDSVCLWKKERKKFLRTVWVNVETLVRTQIQATLRITDNEELVPKGQMGYSEGLFVCMHIYSKLSSVNHTSWPSSQASLCLFASDILGHLERTLITQNLQENTVTKIKHRNNNTPKKKGGKKKGYSLVLHMWRSKMTKMFCFCFCFFQWNECTILAR